MARERTQNDYADRVARVVRHIADHLDDPLDLDRLAEIACFSRWHFHRIYRGVMHETPDQTVRRLRLHRAAAALVESEAAIAEVADRAGYGSLEAFSRAFATAYGRPPTIFRAERRRPGEAGLLPATRNEDPSMTEIFIETTPERTLIGLDHKGPYHEISTAFGALYAWAAPRGLVSPDTEMIGVYFDDPDSVAPADLKSFAAVTAPSGRDLSSVIEAPIRLETLPSGPAAHLTHKGPYADLPASYRLIYAEWLPTSGREPADTPSYEIYRNDPRSTPPTELLTDIYVPLAP